MNIAAFRDDCDAAVIGAGPYGLALAAHLKAAKIETRVFGRAVSFWRDHMPKGMQLVSSWRATHIADPQKRFTLDAYSRQHGFGPLGDRLPLERFVSYGEWFQRQTVSDIDPRQVVRVEDTGRGFCLVLEGGEPIRVRRVVVAAGLAQQELRPPPLTGLHPDLVSHSSDHVRLDCWRGGRVAVLGRGQSACESAALLREAGSEVELICRGDIRWLDPEHDDATSPLGWLARLRPSPAGTSPIGPLPLRWLGARPGLVHRAPDRIRAWINSVSLRPAATVWLRPRLVDVPVLSGRSIKGAAIEGDRIAVTLDHERRVYDHVLLATGYKIDIGKLRMLPAELLRRVAQVDGSPALQPGFVSTVPGLYFIGASAARSFGPLMNSIAGAGYAARSVTHAMLATHALTRRESLLELDGGPQTDADTLRR